MYTECFVDYAYTAFVLSAWSSLSDVKELVYSRYGWLDSRAVSVLDSGAEVPRVQIAVATLSGNRLRQTVHTHCASVHQAAKL